jgi:hypothetical protein
MKDYIDLEEAGEINNLDIGGTPANLLAKDKVGMFLSRGIRPEQLVAIVDPFDLSRVERTLKLAEYATTKNLKFSVDVPGTEKVSSQVVSPPRREKLVQAIDQSKGKLVEAVCNHYGIFGKNEKRLVAGRYDLFKEKVMQTMDSSANLRDFMEALVPALSPIPLSMKRLEGVLSQEAAVVEEILKKRDIEARTFCGECGKMNHYTFNKDHLDETVCCTTTARDLIQKGSYVPEDSMLPVLAYLAGFTPCIVQGREYGLKAIKILKDLGKFDKPIVMYSGKPEKTMFESFLTKN